MRTRTTSAILTAIVLTVACGPGKSEDAAATSPPPYQGSPALQAAEYHKYGDGHRVTVHAVEHRVQGPDEETPALVADVEFCAGATATQSSPWRLFLFQETPFDMQGTMTLMHSSGPPAGLALKEPALPEEELEPGECARGWVGYINVYGDHGKPTMIAFMDESQQDAEVVWPAAEE